MNSIPDATPAVESMRGKQKTAALALAHMLDHDLPTATWTIYDTSGEVIGQILQSSGTPDQRIDAVGAWFEFLDGTLHEMHATVCTTVEASGTYRGASVRVWTNVAAASDKAVQA